MAEGDASKKDDASNVAEEESKQPEQRETWQSTSDWLAQVMKQSLGLGSTEEVPEQFLPEVTVEGVIQYIKSGSCKNIITMAGAGISTSAGIPDFRSPGTGLYDNLAKYNLPSPQAIFHIDFFKENPEPFFHLARELWPGTFKATVGHYFLRLLHEKGLLLRHYTQNIDTLDHVCGLPADKIVEAHGTFQTAHCTEDTCKKEYSQDWMKDQIFAEKIPTCTLEDCGSVVKPDIVFFGEALPVRFHSLTQKDLPQCDLLIIMGTSLVVHPFASLVNRVPQTTPRLYINMEETEPTDPFMAMLGMGHGFKFGQEGNYRDVFWKGTCDDGCSMLAEKLGWKAELDKLVATGHEHTDSGTEALPSSAKAGNPSKSTSGGSQLDGRKAGATNTSDSPTNAAKSVSGSSKSGANSKASTAKSGTKKKASPARSAKKSSPKSGSTKSNGKDPPPSKV